MANESLFLLSFTEVNVAYFRSDSVSVRINRAANPCPAVENERAACLVVDCQYRRSSQIDF